MARKTSTPNPASRTGTGASNSSAVLSGAPHPVRNDRRPPTLDPQACSPQAHGCEICICRDELMVLVVVLSSVVAVAAPAPYFAPGRHCRCTLNDGGNR